VECAGNVAPHHKTDSINRTIITFGDPGNDVSDVSFANKPQVTAHHGLSKTDTQTHWSS
jgi:hypothetical protein